jgi:hypothetical protein
MSTKPTAAIERGAQNKALFWAGWVISLLPVAMLLMSATMKFTKPAPVIQGFTHLGWPEDLALALGIVELASTIIYLIPKTSVLGAILITGYLGGAIATHVRIGEAFIMPVLLGVAAWLGLYLRDARLRQLIPLRTQV